MDHFTRRIIGFGVHRGGVDGEALCWMFQRASRGQTSAKIPQLGSRSAIQVPSMAIQSSVLEVREIKTVPYVPRRMQAGMDIYQNRILADLRRPYLWVPTAGSSVVEGCTRRPSRHDDEFAMDILCAKIFSHCDSAGLILIQSVHVRMHPLVPTGRGCLITRSIESAWEWRDRPAIFR